MSPLCPASACHRSMAWKSVAAVGAVPVRPGPEPVTTSLPVPLADEPAAAVATTRTTRTPRPSGSTAARPAGSGSVLGEAFAAAYFRRAGV